MSFFVGYIVDFLPHVIYSIYIETDDINPKGSFCGERRKGRKFMNLFYHPNIQFMIENVVFFIPNIAREQFLAPVPKHAHGNGSYELHYISSGYGSARINEGVYKLFPDMLYVTGPHVQHEQVPYIDNPMTEYSVFFNIRKNSSGPSCLDPFINTPFWLGENASTLHTLLKVIFKELHNKRVGYLTEVSALLQQAVVFLVRNYQTPRPGSSSGASPGGLYESRAFLTDKAFLYEYQDITLDRLSTDLGLSSRQTERFLKDYYGKTFAQKRTDARSLHHDGERGCGSVRDCRKDRLYIRGLFCKCF